MSAPTWYDVLDVSPAASAEEIRAAWRAAIADLDPTDRRFGALNQAAEVLLDPERRAAYDAELAPAEPEPEPEVASPGVVQPLGERRRVVPAWLLIALAAAVLIVAGVATYVYVTEPSDHSVEDATSAAQSAAERAVVPILSYDAKHLDESRAAAEQYLTGDYRKQYDQLFDGIIKENAPSTGTVLKADLVRSSIVRAGEDRVQVFALVNQTRTNDKVKTPQVYKNWVTITMEKVGGDWLVSGMDT
ncbi:DnaJ domain-containing protein [Nocardioides sp. HB32]